MANQKLPLCLDSWVSQSTNIEVAYLKNQTILGSSRVVKICVVLCLPNCFGQSCTEYVSKIVHLFVSGCEGNNPSNISFVKEKANRSQRTLPP